MSLAHRLIQSGYVVYADGSPKPLTPAEAGDRLHRHPVIFLRGLPGVGKTTMATTLWPRWPRLAADDFATAPDGGARSFPARHDACQGALETHLEHSGRAVVANTFSRHWEIHSYMAVTDWLTEVPLVVHLHHGGLPLDALAARTSHSVPREVIAEMDARWEPWPGELIVSHGRRPAWRPRPILRGWRPWPGLQPMRLDGRPMGTGDATPGGLMQRILERHDNQRLLGDPEAIVAQADALLDHPSPAAVVCGLIVLTGRRPWEIVGQGVFQRQRRDTYHLWFRSGASLRLYAIPVLGAPDRILDALAIVRRRTRAWRPSAALRQACTRAFDALVPGCTPRDLRTVYATLAAYWFAPPNMSDSWYLSTILGHSASDIATVIHSYPGFFLPAAVTLA